MGMKIGAFILILGLAISVWACDLQDGWKGIKVLKSGYADVVNAFGKPTHEDNGEIQYETDDALIRVIFSTGPCRAPDTIRGGFNVREGTVIRYQVLLKKPLTVGELGVDSSRYRRIEDREVLQFVHYYNDREGISLSALKMSDATKDVARTIYFEPNPEQKKSLVCAVD